MMGYCPNLQEIIDQVIATKVDVVTYCDAPLQLGHRQYLDGKGKIFITQNELGKIVVRYLPWEKRDDQN